MTLRIVQKWIVPGTTVTVGRLTSPWYKMGVKNEVIKIKS